MTVSNRYLGDDENVVLETRKSWVLLLWPSLQAVLLLLVGVLIALLPLSDTIDKIGNYLILALVLVAMVRLALAVLGWAMDRIAVTDHRIFEVSGVINRKVSSMPLDKLNDLTYNRSLLGRMFGFGDFFVESAGERQGLDRLEMIPSPDHFYRTVTSVVAHGAPKRTDDEPIDPDDEDTGPIPRVVV
jgi:uncharacterized membrane protein YdbT with pleckstrin-like domain